MTVRIVEAEALRAAVSLGDLIEPVSRAFADYSAGLGETPLAVFAPAGEQGDVHVKSAWLRGWPYFTVKVATWFAARTPATSGYIAVHSATTGDLVALLRDEHHLTDLRTAAAGAIATRLLARPDSTTLTVLGTGTQARLQIEAAARVLPLERILIWGRTPESAHSLATTLTTHPPSTDDVDLHGPPAHGPSAHDLGQHGPPAQSPSTDDVDLHRPPAHDVGLHGPSTGGMSPRVLDTPGPSIGGGRFGAVRGLDGLVVSVVSDPAEAVRQADVIVTATGSREPILHGSWLRPGQHVTAVGADDLTKAELDPACFARADVVAVDSRSLAPLFAGDLTGAVDAELGELILGRHPGRTDPSQITIAKLIGLGIQDLAAATVALEALS